MNRCPTCNLLMDSHSTSELMECCMKQAGEELQEISDNSCPNCKHPIESHSKEELAECSLAYLNSENL